MKIASKGRHIKSVGSTCASMFVVLLISLVTTGCMTAELRKRTKGDSSYTEVVTSILMTENGENIVFIGDDYHYVFDAPEELMKSLRSTFRKSLFAKFKDFRVDGQNKVVGTVTMYLDESASGKDKDEAIKIGYEKQSVGPALEITVFGDRYKSDGTNIDSAGYNLNYTYQVKVNEERSSLEKAAMAAATPITVLADGAMFLIGVPLTLLVISSPH